MTIEMFKTVGCFRGEHRFLSNFYPAETPYEGIIYPTSEHAYQASKTLDVADRTAIASLKITPGQAKQIGKELKKRPAWRFLKTNVMWQIVMSKFLYNADLKKKLIETAPARIQEGNTWGDTFWGVDLSTGKGENMLGKILMDIREQFIT